MQETEPKLLDPATSWNFSEKSEIEFGTEIDSLIKKLGQSVRPLVLIGGAVDRNTSSKPIQKIMNLGIPIATTFNGADRCGIDYEYYAGRPNWYGSRWANLIIQQADLIIAIGARLGLMETGYNWESFATNATIVQIDIEKEELSKGHPRTDLAIQGNPNTFIHEFAEKFKDIQDLRILEWQALVLKIKEQLVKPEKSNTTRQGYVEYAGFVYDLTSKLEKTDMVNPCSSGGNFECFGKVMINKLGQRWVTSPGLASMGFGLSGGIGMALSSPETRTLVFEGDGGMAQNLQEFGVVRSNNLNMKIFIADNGNYGSIKAHQKSAFNNHYIGCDKETGLWLPNWEIIAKAFDIPVLTITSNNYDTMEFQKLFVAPGPAVFVVKVDPDQVIYPKIASKRNPDGVVVSNPLHIMEPPLDPATMKELCPHLI